MALNNRFAELFSPKIEKREREPHSKLTEKLKLVRSVKHSIQKTDSIKKNHEFLYPRKRFIFYLTGSLCLIPTEEGFNMDM